MGDKYSYKFLIGTRYHGPPSTACACDLCIWPSPRLPSCLRLCPCCRIFPWPGPVLVIFGQASYKSAPAFARAGRPASYVYSMYTELKCARWYEQQFLTEAASSSWEPPQTWIRILTSRQHAGQQPLFKGSWLTRDRLNGFATRRLPMK